MGITIPPSESQRRSRRPVRRRGAFLAKLLLAVALGVALRLWVIEVAIVEGQSMEQTLLPGDRVLVLKPVALKRFDVVVLAERETRETVIKRIVGLPEETVSMVPRVQQTGSREVITGSGQLYIDGTPYDEPYATVRMPTTIAPWTLKSGRYYVLGDNRDVSIDSRKYGGVPRELIHGVAYMIIWPLSRAHIIPRTGVPAQAVVGREGSPEA